MMGGSALVLVVLASILRQVSDLSLPLPNTVTVRKCPPLFRIWYVLFVLHVDWLWIANCGPEAATQIGYIGAKDGHYPHSKLNYPSV